MEGSIRQKKNGAFELSASCGYGPGGKQRRLYRTVRGTRKQAEKELQRLVLEAELERNIVDPNINFAGFVEVFRSRHKGASVVTWAQYNNFLNTRILPRFGSDKLKSITTEAVLGFVEELSSENMKIVGNGTRLSSSTVVKYFKLLKQIFACAEKWGYVGKSVCSSIDRNMIVKPMVRHYPILDTNALATLIAKMGECPDTRSVIQNRTFVLGLLVTGCRRGELGCIRWKDINFDKNQISIAKALKTINGVTIGEGRTKNGVDRIVFFDKKWRNMLMMHRAAQEKWLRETQITNKMDLVFTCSKASPSGETMLFRPKSVYKWLRNICVKYNIRATDGRFPGLHSFRGMFTTIAASSGMGINLLGGALGDKTLSALACYTHDLLELRRESTEVFFDKLDEINKGN